MSEEREFPTVNFADLTLHYQPQLAADGSKIVAAEALLRVSRPIPRLMSAADVIARFSTPGEAETLDWWVIRMACNDARSWPSISTAINVSASHFRKADFAGNLLNLVHEIGVDPRMIELEIIESAYIDDFDAAIANIVQLRSSGFRVAIDDFGTGYSSLAYLLKLPIDKLKIDKSFVDGIGNMKSAAIVHAIVALARAIGLKITAEGVETKEQYQFLRLAGCHFIQGWYFSKAVDADRLRDMLARGAVPNSETA